LVKLSYKQWNLEVPGYVLNNRGIIWGKYLLKKIAEDNIFKTKYILNHPRISGGRMDNKFTPFILNGKKCLIDEWDYSYPTVYVNKEYIKKNPFLSDLKYIFKIQYCKHDKKIYDDIKQDLNVKVLPFFIFPRHDIPLEIFKWKNENHKYSAMFSGRVWRGRNRWKAVMDSDKTFFSTVNNPDCKIESQRFNYVSNDDYIVLLKQMKWGLSLVGKGCGGKNRREVEYMSYGMPMVLNYIPIYPFSFIPNKDFLYLEKPEDLQKLKHVDPLPYSIRSAKLYKKYFKPENLGKALITLFGHLF